MRTQEFHVGAAGRSNKALKLTASQRAFHPLTRMLVAARRGSLSPAFGGYRLMDAATDDTPFKAS